MGVCIWTMWLLLHSIQFIPLLNHILVPIYTFLCRFLQGSHFFPLMKFPDFSSISVIFPWLFSRAQKCKLYLFMTSNEVINFKLKLHGDNWNVIKCYVCPQYSLIMNTVFHNVELIFNKNMTGNNWFEIFPIKNFFLFSDLIFPDSYKIPWLFWYNFKIP